MSDRKKRADTLRRVSKAKEVFDKYGREIRAIIEFTARDKQTTEDVFQDFFITIVENPIPPEIEDIRNYIYKCIVNDAIDRLRRARIQRDGIKRYTELYFRDKSEQMEPHKKVIIAEEIEQMFSLMEESLPPRHSRVLMQYYGTDHRACENSEQVKIDRRSFSRYLCDEMKNMRKVALKRKKEAIYLGSQTPAFE